MRLCLVSVLRDDSQIMRCEYNIKGLRHTAGLFWPLPSNAAFKNCQETCIKALDAMFFLHFAQCLALTPGNCRARVSKKKQNYICTIMFMYILCNEGKINFSCIFFLHISYRFFLIYAIYTILHILCIYHIIYITYIMYIS